MTGRHSATNRRTAPVLECLEDRKLLNSRIITPSGKPINDQDLAHYQLQKQNNVPLSDRRIAYTTPDGTRVQLTLFGFGTLKGTTIRSNGALDLVYNNTTSTSKIVGHVSGGTGRAPLISFRDADVTPGSPSATGSSPINVVNLKKFDLLPNGFMNIRGGVGTLALNSTAATSRIYIAALPTSTSSSSASSSNDVVQIPLDTVSTVGGNTTVTVTPTATSTTTVPPGPEVTILDVKGAPRKTALGNPQIFGFDPVAGALIRFDAVNGAALQSIPVAGGGTAIAGVGLGRDNGREVALVGTGTTIHVYDVVTGASVGQFSTASLASLGLTNIDGIGSSDTRTFVSDASAGVNGLIQSIDVTASLMTGQAVAKGIPFAPAREFEISGGVTGLAGSNTIFTTGAAHFDTFVPDRFQLGVLSFQPTTVSARETSRLPIPGVTTSTIDAGLSGASRPNPTAAMGSIGGYLAIVTAVVNGKNVVSLYAPSATALTASGTVNLASPNRLAGLSESFHPELAGGALLDVSSALRRFVSNKATGLVLNASGAVNLVQIASATDTAVVGRPLNHVNIPKRNNVTLLSSARGPGGFSSKNGVTVKTLAKPEGVLTLP